MILGITETLHEKNRLTIYKRIGIVTSVFLVSAFIPFVLYALFHFNLVPSKSAFSADVQEPVAKVLTNDGIGTAFLITPTILLTARHVVENGHVGDVVQLFFEQSKNKYQTTAKIKYISPASQHSVDGKVSMDYFLTDVAVLEVSAISDIEPLALGESDAVQNLDDVILIGFPQGDYSITKGNINSDKFQGLNLFKLDATSNPGNSGGPCILKEDNTVIGILVGGSGAGYQGENIALKINDVKTILRNAKISF
jgi:S1-C subfamily serine protease